MRILITYVDNIVVVVVLEWFSFVNFLEGLILMNLAFFHHYFAKI